MFTIRKCGVSVSRFKATCLALLTKVKRTWRPILVTRKGEPIAQIAPPPPPEKPASRLGSFSATGRITGDIVSPTVPDSEWDTPAVVKLLSDTPIFPWNLLEPTRLSKRVAATLQDPLSEPRALADRRQERPHARQAAVSASSRTRRPGSVESPASVEGRGTRATTRL